MIKNYLGIPSPMRLISQELAGCKPGFDSQEQAEEFIRAYDLVCKVVGDTVKSLGGNIQEGVNQAFFLIQEYPFIFDQFKGKTSLDQDIAMNVLKALSQAHEFACTTRAQLH